MPRKLAKAGAKTSPEVPDLVLAEKNARQIPDKISIGGHVLTVTRQKDLMDQADACGIFDSTKLSIAIDSSLPESLAWETFWHEVVEALNYFSEASMEHKSIQTFGLLLHQVMSSME
jgi:hypothetical protein